MSIDDWVTEAEALSDIWEGEDEETDGEGDIFGLPRRYKLPAREQAVVISKERMLARYETAKAAKTGTVCTCPVCSKDFTKKSYQQAFCSNKGRNNCKDLFWNRASEQRLQRAKAYTRQ
jgi:hypothetical protein